MDSLSVRDRRLHREIGKHLKEMVLDDVADGAGLRRRTPPRPCTPKFSAIVICTLSTCSRFQNGSRKELAKRKNIILWTGRLPRKWSMRKMATLGKVREQRLVQAACADARSWPNGFSTMMRAPVAQPRLRQLLHDRLEQHGRDGEVVRGLLRAAELLAQFGERRGVRVVAVHVAQQVASACRTPARRCRRVSRRCRGRAP